MHVQLLLRSDCKLPEGRHGMLYSAVQGLTLGVEGTWEEVGREGREEEGERMGGAEKTGSWPSPASLQPP